MIYHQKPNLFFRDTHRHRQFFCVLLWYRIYFYNYIINLLEKFIADFIVSAITKIHAQHIQHSDHEKNRKEEEKKRFFFFGKNAHHASHTHTKYTIYYAVCNKIYTVWYMHARIKKNSNTHTHTNNNIENIVKENSVTTTITTRENNELYMLAYKEWDFWVGAVSHLNFTCLYIYFVLFCLIFNIYIYS